ncbi:DUF4913 domain-containing protein [Micromonospora inyonensis]|uniref:DUF4913 domain-containing protein n=1 Tax=Micromonospora inyonensis TaxID=47866 RepID=A0A1C6S8V4_9ACTN|nr:DUF4913 domain-containing protein [Micromonospora inyonensis]SCL25889.1 protein of unknown function [Micromonospora inyonensis]
MTSPTSGPGTDPVADLTNPLDQIAGTPEEPAPAHDPNAPEPVFRNIDQFVSGYLALVLERRVASGPTPGINWCPRWWAHPEALSRLYALWRAWEALRVNDPHTGMSVWWRDHLDPHLAVLTGDAGPFTRCGSDRHRDPEPLHVEPAPTEVLAQLPDA